MAARLIVALLTLGIGASSQAQIVPEGCADLSSIVPFTQFRYDQFQAIYDTVDPKSGNTLCTTCHPGNVGSAALGLGDGFSYNNLVGVVSAQDPMRFRVEPGNPQQSWFFIKMNCDSPGVGAQMPFGASALSLVQQRLFFDWIRVGAPLSKNGFEDR